MAKKSARSSESVSRATPVINQKAREIQAFGQIIHMPIALSIKACQQSVDNLNQLLADTMTLRDLYKKHHWQLSGATFNQLHLLFDKHYDEQNVLVDSIAELIQMLGGLSVAMAPAAHASGSSMPWEQPLQQILQSIEGPVAKIIAVIIIIVTGLTLAFGDTSGGFRRLIQIVFGLSIAFAASSFFLSFFSFGGGALV